ncbi:hypothetical protein BRYFOR_06080 [Marvinbryantia formatexigens DSM 14469]|uniref:Uncharacterized protein n=1 Tax=Marvinbryantia formatexigens DSM 14469 TaxID=478749 RepID=C6LBT5_9FIRM|nr:hypothetical protein BRYFOR_06080 [Marvinbryantia formatexigens DSM 14469]
MLIFSTSIIMKQKQSECFSSILNVQSTEKSMEAYFNDNAGAAAPP